MLGTVFPCGDPVAGRRAGFAETLAHLGDMPAAIEVLHGVLEMVPDWAAGWFRLGEWLELCAAPEAAAEAWDKAVAVDPRDPLGAGLRRDLLRGVPVIETMPPAFVELLFDQYAPRFDRALVDKLAYRGPELLLAALRRQGFARAGRALDLGCGTGLMGALLRPQCDWLGGYDISAGMLAEAAMKGDYDLLAKRDIAQLELGGAAHDLIVAADVFIYLGALERIIGWCAGALAPGGHLAFTIELGEVPVQLQESRRFTHSRAYVEQLLAQAGFTGACFEDCVLRRDRGIGVAALVVTAQTAGHVQSREGDAAEALA